MQLPPNLREVRRLDAVLDAKPSSTVALLEQLLIEQGRRGDDVASLAGLTRQAVLAAIAQYRTDGRDSFLKGFRPSTDYFLLDGTDLLDTKPLVAAALKIQRSDTQRMVSRDFRGGTQGAVRVLRSLGFDVVTRAQMNPPQLGDHYPTRTALYEKFGGDKIAGMVRFPGEATVNIFSDADGPYSDDAPTLTSTFGYRGQGLNGPQSISFGGNARLEDARKNCAAARFWYRPSGGEFTFLSWVVVLGRSWVAGVGQDGIPRPELKWQLESVPSPLEERWSSDLRSRLHESANSTENDKNVPEARSQATYAELVSRVETRSQPKRPTGVVRTDYARSAAARRAVVERSQGACESLRCTGMPPERNRRGEPILDVDHVHDLALGGEDHPRNMVALCPNCHAVKTRGANTGRWRRELAQAAVAAHRTALKLEK